MEILVSKTALLDKLKSVGRIIQPKNTLPAYDNFCLSLTNQALFK